MKPLAICLVLIALVGCDTKITYKLRPVEEYSKTHQVSCIYLAGTTNIIQHSEIVNGVRTELITESDYKCSDGAIIRERSSL